MIPQRRVLADVAPRIAGDPERVVATAPGGRAVALEQLIQEYGYWAILLGTMLEGETVLILGGFAAHRGYLSLPAVIAVAFVGTLCGDQFFFYLGRRHAQAVLARYPTWNARIDRARQLLERYHQPLLLVFRFLYGLRSVIPFAVGLSRIRAVQFVALNVAGAAVWAVLVAVAGYTFGSAVEAVIRDIKHYELGAMALVAAVGVGVWVAYFYRKRRRRLKGRRK